MRYSILYLLLIICHSLFGQLKIVPIAGTNSSTSSRVENNHTIEDTISLPFWDDFAKTRTYADTLLWKNGSNIYINNFLPVNPPTIFVASFDGVDKDGKAYSQQTTFSGLGDELESLPIDMTQVPQSRRNTVFFSFFWQLKGFGERPDDKDSLLLEFRALDSTWVTQDINSDNTHLALVGGLESLILGPDSLPAFSQIVIPVNDPIYFHEGFKFRFQSYSNLSGIYDTWHIDYVYLNEFRSSSNPEITETALNGTPSLLFDPYYEMPLNQFLANPNRYFNQQSITVSNLGISLRPIDPFHHFTNLNSGESIFLFDTLPQISPNGLEFGRILTGRDISTLNISGDSVVLESVFSLFTGDSLLSATAPDDTPFFYPYDLKVNDTLATRYTLHDHYAYDDGSAEFAAGINLISGQLAVAFFAEETDILTEVDIHFPTVNPTSDGQTVDVQIWGSLDNFPLWIQPTVIEKKDRNEYQRIKLSLPVQVSDTFYVGYKQFTNEYIGIGLDRNNNGGQDKIWVNTNRIWENNNRLEGSLMIRPVFGQQVLDTILSIDTRPPIASYIVYPNPMSSAFKIKGDYDRIEIIGLDGRKVLSSEKKDSYVIDGLYPGLYILRIFHKGLISRRKILIAP